MCGNVFLVHVEGRSFVLRVDLTPVVEHDDEHYAFCSGPVFQCLPQRVIFEKQLGEFASACACVPNIDFQPFGIDQKCLRLVFPASFWSVVSSVNVRQ